MLFCQYKSEVGCASLGLDSSDVSVDGDANVDHGSFFRASVSTLGGRTLRSKHALAFLACVCEFCRQLNMAWPW